MTKFRQGLNKLPPQPFPFGAARVDRKRCECAGVRRDGVRVRGLVRGAVSIGLRWLCCMAPTLGTNLRASASGANGRGRDETMRVVGAEDAPAVSAAARLLPAWQP